MTRLSAFWSLRASLWQGPLSLGLMVEVLFSPSAGKVRLGDSLRDGADASETDAVGRSI